MYIREKQNILIPFGTGLDMQREYRTILDLGFVIDFFVDNDERKWGTSFNGHEIKPPKALLSESKEKTIVIATEDYKQQIIEQLMDLGIYYERNCISLFDLEYEELSKRFSTMEVLHGSVSDPADISVLYDSQVFSMQESGGVSRYNYEIIKRMVYQDGVSVNMFRGINNNCYDFADAMTRFHNYYSDNAQMTNGRHMDAINAGLIRQFADQIPRIDIYHPTYYAEYGIRNYSRLVVTVYDMIHEMYYIDDRTPVRKKRLINHADGIIAISESTKKDLIEIYNLNPEKIKVIYAANSLQCDVKEPPVVDGDYLLYVGQRGNYKNGTMLMRAFSRSRYKKDFRLVFMGGGDFSNEERQLINSLGLEDQVTHCVGNDTVLANLYKYAYYFIYPSKYEGFGMPLLEAMHYGAPVITSNKSSMPEVAGDAALYFEPEDEDSIIEALDVSKGNESMRKQLINRGYEREKLFSWDNSSDALCCYYRELIK